MTKWTIIITDTFEKSFKKLDFSTQKRIKSWIKTHLENIDNPRDYGKPLKYSLKNHWRYRIGDYRLIVEIKDNELIIIAINIGHRSQIYKK